MKLYGLRFVSLLFLLCDSYAFGIDVFQGWVILLNPLYSEKKYLFRLYCLSFELDWCYFTLEFEIWCLKLYYSFLSYCRKSNKPIRYWYQDSSQLGPWGISSIFAALWIFIILFHWHRWNEILIDIFCMITILGNNLVLCLSMHVI